MPWKRCVVLVTLGLFYATAPAWGDQRDRLQVGMQPDGCIVVPTNQILKPAGKQVLFPGRPVDLALAEGGKTLVVKNMRDLVFIDLATATVKQTLRLTKRGEGFSVVGLVVHGDRVYASDAQNQVRVALRQADGKYVWGPNIDLEKPKVGKEVHPAGMALLGNDKLWVTSTRGNNVQLIDLKTGKIEQVVSVGVAPYTIVCPTPNRCFVSNWGGDPPKEGDPQAKSSETPIRIDPKTGIANDGTVSVLEKIDGKWRQTKTIRVGLQSSGMALSPSGRFLYIANANSDTISVVEVAKAEVVETIACRPERRLPFGSGSNAVAVSPRGDELYVANGTNNCVAVVSPLSPRSGDLTVVSREQVPSRLAGLIPTGWYPGAILVSGNQLIVANVKGHGSLAHHRPGEKERPAEKGMNTHDHLGTVSIIDIPDVAQLAKYTAEVNANNRLAYSLAGLEKPRPDAKPVPLPQRHGEPSLFKHVIYVVKENRTYDQLLGDMKEGNGDPRLCIFGETVTPNHHKLAREFTLFDNFYCSGVLSADGHSWVNEAYVTDYLEKAFGGFTRSYPDEGSDPLAYPSSGFLWDNAFARKKTVRMYGEFVKTTYLPKDATWTQWYDQYKKGGGPLRVESKSNLKTLEAFTHPNYPWFPLMMPDVYRARLFLDDLKEFEKKGAMPNLVYVTLPCDHTDGTRPGYPTPRAMVADNDLALGQIVEAVSKSKFWKDTCIFVVEDDPQDGFDHVDAHRTAAFVISPYTRRRFVDHICYNQTGMVKSIELILGLPPMNQLDLSATPMHGCFQDAPDLTPYTAVPNQVALDEMNPELKSLKGRALYWAQKSLEMNFDDGDAADEDTLNQILWHATQGDKKPYPERFTRKNED